MDFLRRPLTKFIQLETSSSIVLFFATILALILANSPVGPSFLAIWDNKISISIPGLEISKPLLKWINDGLMAIFFFLIGLEIKREVTFGELSRFKRASLPLFAAIGGMITPAVLFTFLNWGEPGSQGWGIPIAADIAFTLGILQLLGKRVPPGLKIFLMAFAIIDDLGAVLIIAFFYSSKLIWTNILAGLVIVVFLIIFGQRGYYSKYLFFIAGLIVWVLFLKSGIHSTIAGVLMAMTIPTSRKINTRSFYNESKELLDEFYRECKDTEDKSSLTKHQAEALFIMEELTAKTTPALQYLEHKLHGWVSYLIMPLFAFANAGVVFNFSGETNFSLAGNIAISMIIGNTLGIFTFSFLAIKFNIAELPNHVNIRQLLSMSILGGLGFTMSLFINDLAFENPLLINSAKLGILMGSLVAGFLGYMMLKFTLPGKVSY